jgi:hypothetical protein
MAMGTGPSGARTGAKRPDQKLVEDAIVFDFERLAERDSRAGSQVALGGFEGCLRRFRHHSSGRHRLVDETVSLRYRIHQAQAMRFGGIDAPAGET